MVARKFTKVSAIIHKPFPQKNIHTQNGRTLVTQLKERPLNEHNDIQVVIRSMQSDTNN